MNFSNIERSQVPYYFAVAKDIFSPELYAALVRYWPDESTFVEMGEGYRKLSLSERNNRGLYHTFIAASPEWTELYSYLKSQQFRGEVFKALNMAPVGIFTSRFEFSSMPADGGFIAPHTDIPSKVVTLVVPIVEPGTWSPEWGGGTDLLKPKDTSVNHIDYKAPLSEFEKVWTVPYEPNQALLFVKSASSWHSAGPFQGPEGVWRRTLTINIERAS